MSSLLVVERRRFLRSTVIVASTFFASRPLLGLAAPKAPEKEGAEDVSAVEDLMREHGALDRILLIYDEAARRISVREKMDPALLNESAQLVRDFIEGYHEKLEEQYVFPRLKKAHRLESTVNILLAQHQAGRKVTDKILSLSTDAHLGNARDSKELLSALQSFNRMYRPHAAREDTEVFPEFKKVVSGQEYDQLGVRGGGASPVR